MKYWNILSTKPCEISLHGDVHSLAKQDLLYDATLKLDSLWADGWASWSLGIPSIQHFSTLHQALNPQVPSEALSATSWGLAHTPEFIKQKVLPWWTAAQHSPSGTWKCKNPACARPQGPPESREIWGHCAADGCNPEQCGYEPGLVIQLWG